MFFLNFFAFEFNLKQMKKNILSAAFAAITAFTLNAQNVNIPDANFKSYLVGDPNINTNMDSEIQLSEAQTYSGAILCSSLNITDLTGIEEFTSLTVLACNNNLITNLNLSSNTALIELYCGQNLFTSLDVSNHTALTKLYCGTGGSGVITSVNTTNCTSLTDFRCMFNQITSLDVSTNTSLTYLDFSGNLMASANLANGNNTAFNKIYAYSNPNLTCIQVDNVSYSNANWTGGNFQIQAGANFSLDCNSPTGINELNEENNTIVVYPNPTKNQINFSLLTNVQLTNVTGQIIADKKNVNTLDLSNQLSGIYFLTLTDKNGQVIQRSKIVKE